MIWVIDASVALRWFLSKETHPNSEIVLEELLRAPERFIIPELFAFELYTVLLRLHPSGPEVFKEAVLPILEGGILRYPMTAELAKGADRFVENGLTGYDACYAALAKMNSGVWLTFDRKAHLAIKRKQVSWDLAKGLPEGWPDG